MSIETILQAMERVRDSVIPDDEFEMEVGLLSNWIQGIRDQLAQAGPDPSPTRPILLELTRDELIILRYMCGISSSSDYGDPLKDTYELGDDEPVDPYAAAASVTRKVYAAAWEPETPNKVPAVPAASDDGGDDEDDEDDEGVIGGSRGPRGPA